MNTKYKRTTGRVLTEWRGKVFVLLLVTVLAVAFLTAGCLLDDKPLYKIAYIATYDDPLDVGVIERVFAENNITIYKRVFTEYDAMEMTDKMVELYFHFPDPANKDEEVPSLEGVLMIFPEETHYLFYEMGTGLNLWPNAYKYPPSESKEVVEGYKPVLERGKNYLTELIYNSTGLKPTSGFYDVSGDVPAEEVG